MITQEYDKLNNVEKSEDRRKIYLDVLRFFAIFLVLFTHTGTKGVKLYTAYPESPFAFFYIILDCFRTINNPLLFMISGVLLLGKNESVSQLWRKRVIRFIVLLVVFTYIQAIYKIAVNSEISSFDFKETFIKMLEQPIRTPYWFLYSYISYLIMLPFLRKIAEYIDDKEFFYLIVISVVTMDLFPFIKLWLGVSQINFNVFINSFTTLYPIIGYYIDLKWDEWKKKYRWLYGVLFLLSVFGVLCASYMTRFHYRQTNEWGEQYITLFYTVNAIFIFVTVKDVVKTVSSHIGQSNWNKIALLLQGISGTMFGIYLMENILEAVTKNVYLILDNDIPKLISCLIYLVATMLFGIGVIWILRRIPIVRKII